LVKGKEGEGKKIDQKSSPTGGEGKTPNDLENPKGQKGRERKVMGKKKEASLSSRREGRICGKKDFCNPQRT